MAFEIYNIKSGKALAKQFEDIESLKAFVLKEYGSKDKIPTDLSYRDTRVAPLRAEAAKQASLVATPAASEAYGRSIDARDAEIAASKQRMADMQAAQGSDLFSLETLKQAGRGFPKLVTSAVSALASPDKYPNEQGEMETNRLQTFADRFQLPYESELAQSTLGDPTLIPSMMIPGVGEAKLAVLSGKLGPKITPILKTIYESAEAAPSMGKLAQAGATVRNVAPRAADAAIQSGVSMLGSGEQDFTGNLLAGTAVGEAARLAGGGIKAGGSRLIQSVIKPGATVDKKTLVSNLMDTNLPDSDKKVIGPFTTTEGAITKVEDAIQSYGEKETGGISRKETDLMREWNASTINRHLDEVESEIYRKKLNREISPEEADRMSAILDQERVRLTGKKPDTYTEVPPTAEDPSGLNVVEGERIMPDPTLMDLHRAKQDYGTKSRFDQKNTSTADPTVRNTYQMLYNAARGGIVEEEGSRVAADLRATNPQHALNEAAAVYNRGNTNTIKFGNLLRQKLGEIQAQIIKERPDLASADVSRAAVDILTSTPDGAKLMEAWGKASEATSAALRKYDEYRNELSRYNWYSKAMAPLMDVREPLGKAYDRNANSYPLSLQMLLAAATGSGATQSPWGLLAGVAPAAIQSMPAGTAMYRLGEALPGAAAKLNPILMRAMPEVQPENQQENMVPMSSLSSTQKPQNMAKNGK